MAPCSSRAPLCLPEKAESKEAESNEGELQDNKSQDNEEKCRKKKYREEKVGEEKFREVSITSNQERWDSSPVFDSKSHLSTSEKSKGYIESLCANYSGETDIHESKKRQIPKFIKIAHKLSLFYSLYTVEKITKKFNVSKKIAEQTRLEFIHIAQNDQETSPAIYKYSGALFKALNSTSFSKPEVNYLNETTFILSGLYGILRPLDQIPKYRLEMGMPLGAFETAALTAFWKENISNVIKEKHKQLAGSTLVILASSEYSAAIDNEILRSKKSVNIKFLKKTQKGVKTIAIHSKQCRGALLRYATKAQATSLDELKSFSHIGYEYSRELSSSSTIVYLNKSV